MDKHFENHGDSFPGAFYADADADGFGDPNFVDVCPNPGFVENSNDCDDANGAVNPAQTEIVGNGIDDDCNPDTPDDVSVALQCQCWAGINVSDLHPFIAGGNFQCFNPDAPGLYISWGFDDQAGGALHNYRVRIAASYDVPTGVYSCSFHDTCTDNDCSNVQSDIFFGTNAAAIEQHRICRAELPDLTFARNANCTVPPP